MQKADGYSEFADKYGLDVSDVAMYADGMRKGSSAQAARAMAEIGRKIIAAHEDEIHSLLDMRKFRRPVEKALKNVFGDVDRLVEERRKQVEEERKTMEAARKRAEEEQRKREARLEELAELTDEDIDNRYAEALAKGDEAVAREMLDEAARRKGYGDADSDYQGVGAWSAPSKPDYETDEARRNAVGEDSPDLNVEDMAAGYNNQPEDIFVHPNKYSQGLPTSEESGKAIHTAIDDIRNGKKGVKIKVYRAVPTSVKEGKLRNGDWVTPSKRYAEIHGDHRLDGKYRIIEDEVPVSELWWDGNDVNEWGYDNGKSYRYKNVKNSRKLNDLVTRDDKGNVIPPSKRFNQRKADERYQRGVGGVKPSKAEVALRDAVIDRLRENGMDVIADEAEGQRVLDEANGRGETVRSQAMLSSLTKAANTIRGWLATGKRGKSFTIELPEATQRMIRKVMGRDFDSHNITANGVVHAQKNHGVNGNKISDSSIPLREQDMELMPYIMVAPDYVRKGSEDVTGRTSVRFYKELSNGYVVVAEKEYKNSPDDMETITMWAEMSDKATNAQHIAAPDTHVRNAILDIDAAKIRKDAEDAIVSDVKIRENRVFHGSGAEFDAFDHSHMGEGEGSQSFGWGTYVTSSSAIGKSYAKRSATGSGIKRSELESNISRAKEQLPFVRGEVKEELEAKIGDWENQLENLDESRHLYTVEIPEDTGNNYLDWYSTLSKEQKDTITKVLTRLHVDLTDYERRGFSLDDTIGDIYHFLTIALRHTRKWQDVNASRASSKFLSSLGFTGIKYPAGTIHGGAEKGDMNYVIFNEKDAKITYHVRFFRTANGEAYGFTVGGKIYIDPKIATSETPVHEYAHLWAEALRNGNPKEWQNVVKLMKDTKVWDEVKTRYPELKSDGEIADEVIATYSGRRGAERLREELRKTTAGNSGVYEKIEAISAFEKVKQSLEKFWKGVADFLHIRYTSAEEVADRVMKDLLDGVDPRGSEKRKVKSEKSNGNPRFQFIGEKGAAEADHAEEVSARLDNLSVARDMEAEKKDAKAIKMATGWERGADGKWRYEIADMKEFDRNGNLLYRKHHPDYARYIELQDKELKNLFEDGEELTDKEREEYEALSKKYESDKFGGEKLDNNHTLEAYVDAPELFKAYPELRNVRMTFMDTGGDEIASYHHISSVFEVDKDDVGEIVVNTGKVSANTRTKELKSVVLHEMQHAIQDMEGFARGGNTERIKSDFLEAKAEWAARAYAHELEETAKALGEDYDQLGVERALIKEYEDMGMSDELPDKDTRIKGFNYFARGYADRSLDDAIKRFRLSESTRGDFNPYIEYRSLAGEVEARNVQKRMDMSAEERRASLAADTEDVSREDQVFLMGNNGVSEKDNRTEKHAADMHGKDNGVMYRIKRAAEMYNKAKGGSKGQRDGRVVPEDVDKKTSEGIEKKFDEEIGEVESDFDSKEEFMQAVSDKIFLASRYRKSVLENQKKQLENELRRKESNTGENSEGAGTGRLASVNADNKTTLQGHRDKAQDRIALAAINRELDYRRVRAENLRNTYGLSAGSEIGFGEVEKIFRQSNTSPELGKLFAQTRDVLKRLGVDFGVQDEINSGKLTSPMGYASPERDIRYSIDGLVKTSSSKVELPVTILHEMIHEGVNGAIHLVKSGKADGMLTPKQIEAVETISEIYDRAVGNQEKFRENNYGLEDEYEFAAQMADPRQRKALDLGVMDRVVNFAKELMRKGDRSVWERVKDAVKKLFEVSDKSKMDKAIEDILEDFNKTVDDAAMVDVDENGWSYSDGKALEDKPRYASLSLSQPLEGRIAETVEKVSKQTGGKVKMVNSVEEIENPKVRKDIENGKQVTGWYDEKTGEVHLYMPNIHDSYTAEKTVWHETVGHKGMRGLLGDKFNDYMRSLWMDLDNPINAELRAYVKEKMNMNHLGFYDAIEEFIAKSAEDGKGEPGFWNYIKNKVTDALHEIGYRVSPNVKDVKYMLWLAKNVQKHGDSPLWKMRAEAVKWKIEHEKTEYTKIHGGELYDNDGKSHDFEGMSRKEWLEATDGQIHYRTAPSAATALDRYHHALARHGYMATEAFMDNMLSLKKLMEAIDPSIKKIDDVASSMNPYMMQTLTEGKMSNESELFRIRYMEPLDKAMSSVLDSFDGKKVDDRIRNFNLYMIRKHGLERNRVLFVRDWIKSEKGKVKSGKSNSIDALETAWKDERSDLRQKLDSGQIDLKEYYRQMDEWIVQNLDKDFKAEEHDYSGMHGLQGIADKKAAYDDAGAIDEVMSQEASMESMKKGSVADFWKKVKAATDYSVNSDYENNIISKETHDGVLDMFDWYVPLRKFDEATAEDVYGYVTEKGDPSNYIGTTLMNAKGRKSLSNVEILAQIGLMGNRAIRNGGQNSIKLAFARFVRNSGEQNLVKETKVWVKKTGTDLNGNDIWEEAYPQIPEGASADDVASIVNAFEADMKAKQANGEAKTLSSGTDIGFKFQRAKDKSQHFVDVKIAGRTHRFVVLGNPRAAQALNGMLENGKASQKWLQTVTRWMAMASTSWSPEFVMRNIVRDAEFASSHVRAKEGGRYAKKWARYYGELNPLNVFYNEGAGRLKSMKMKDFKNGVGFGLYARYREGTLGNSKMERYFKEFMENGGETGFVQLFSMLDMEKSYKSIVEKESAKGAKKVMVNAMEVLKNLDKNVESLNEVAENMARFATYCTSRDLGRSAARSAYDAKEVSTNFNRHGSGYGVLSFKNGEMSGLKMAEQKLYGGLSGWLRNYSMFFNAGIQSTNLLFKNFKRAPVGTAVAMTSAPFALALIMAAVNNAIIQNEDDKDRGNVKDPYGELPDYIRRNNLCIYVGKNRFVTVPLAIELRAFYSLGDLAAGQTFAKNVKSQRNMAMDAVGCMSQLFPVVDFLNNPNYEKSRKNMAAMTAEGLAPTAFVPFIEWWLNNDWKDAPIRRTGDKAELNPAWQNAYNNVPARLVDLNKWVNAKTNNIAPGNPEMKGNDALDWITDPSMLNHFYDSWSSGMGTFVQRTAGLGAKATTGKADEIEVGDVPFLRSLFYTPREQSSMARTKAKWYNYKEEMEQTIANNDKLKSKNVPTMKRIENAAALEKFEGSPEQRKENIIKNAEKRMRHWNTMRKKWADDKKQVDFANHNIEMIMQEAVADLDRVE